MTYYSLNVRAYPERLSTEKLEHYGLKNPVVLPLSHRERDCGPYRLADWAKTRGLEVFYVDNCWVRVPVHSADLRAFFREVLGSEDDLVGFVLDPEGAYLIEAEEF